MNKFRDTTPLRFSFRAMTTQFPFQNQLPSVQGPQYSKVFQQLAWKENVHCVLHHSLKTNQRFLLASLILS